MKNVRLDDWESLKPSVFGWGINDVNYKISVKKELYTVDGNRKRVSLWECPYYQDWYSILRRCLCPIYISKNPTYKDCTICEDWKYFSNFIKWVDSQPNRDWVNCVPDKDLLLTNNKHYSSKTVVYISKQVNVFMVDHKNARGKYLLGVTDSIGKNKPFKATCCNPFVTGCRHIGVFKTELEAHLAWQAKKHEYACLLAEKQTDLRVAMALRERYAPDKDWTKA